MNSLGRLAPLSRMPGGSGGTTVRTLCLSALSLMLASGLGTPCRAGILYGTCDSSNTIEEFTPGGVGSVFANTGLTNPVGLAFDSAGNLYGANIANNTIEEFTSGGVGSVFATGLSGPYGLAFDSAGNLYAANFYTSTIEEFTPGGVGSVFANTGLTNPVAWPSTARAISMRQTIPTARSRSSLRGALARSSQPA